MKAMLFLAVAIFATGWINAEMELATIRPNWAHEMAENVMLRGEVESLKAEREVYFWDFLKREGADMEVSDY